MTENTASRNNIPSVLKGFLEKPDLGSFPNVSRVGAHLVSDVPVERAATENSCVQMKRSAFKKKISPIALYFSYHSPELQHPREVG